MSPVDMALASRLGLAGGKLSTADPALATRIAERLTEAVIQGSLPAGTKLNEVELAEAFGTSRTPVREALRMLEKDRLVTFTRRKGAAVSDLSKREVTDIYLCRAYLNGLAARLAATQATDEQIDQLEALLGEMEVAEGRGDANVYFPLLVRLAERIAELSENDPLIKVTASLGLSTYRLRFISITQPGGMQRSLDGYQQLIAAIKKRDGEGAERVARTLIANTVEQLLQTYYGSDASAEDLPAMEVHRAILDEQEPDEVSRS